MVGQHESQKNANKNNNNHHHGHDKHSHRDRGKQIRERNSQNMAQEMLTMQDKATTRHQSESESGSSVGGRGVGDLLGCFFLLS